MLLQGRGGSWQLVASSPLSKLFIDLAARHALLSTPDCGLCLSRTPMSHFLGVSSRMFLCGKAHLPSLQMLHMGPCAK